MRASAEGAEVSLAEFVVPAGDAVGAFAAPNRKFVQVVKDAAAARKLPLQFGPVTGYGDDSAEIQKGSGGVPTVCLLVPVRYTHARNGIMNRRDFDQTVELLVELLQRLDAAVQRIRDFTP